MSKHVIFTLDGGFKEFLCLTLLPGDMIQFDSCFSNGLKPLTSTVSSGAGLCQQYDDQTCPREDDYGWRDIVHQAYVNDAK